MRNPLWHLSVKCTACFSIRNRCCLAQVSFTTKEISSSLRSSVSILSLSLRSRASMLSSILLVSLRSRASINLQRKCISDSGTNLSKAEASLPTADATLSCIHGARTAKQKEERRTKRTRGIATMTREISPHKSSVVFANRKKSGPTFENLGRNAS